jgi:FAD dependent oxidoreductase
VATISERHTGGVVVCGGGAAGMAAALAAARAGADVRLVEANPRLGGTVASALIHTLAGFYDSAGKFINDGLATELAEALMRADATTRRRRLGQTWVLSVCPDVYRAAAGKWIGENPRISVLCSAKVCGAKVSGNRIVELEAVTERGTARLRANAVVDATGSGAVVRLANPALLQNSGKRAAGGLIFSMGGVMPDALAFPRGLAVVRALRAAADEGKLPPECNKSWIDSGVHEGEIYVKLFVPIPEDWAEREEHGEITRAALKTQAAVVGFLKSRPEFARARVGQTGNVGIRDGGRVCGEYCLTATDVRQARKFEDAACRCCWPIEYWDPDEGVSLEYLPDGTWYEIPLRALKAQGLSNVWVAGKCLSADPLAQASARVVGTCWAMGEAVGKAAAQL